MTKFVVRKRGRGWIVCVPPGSVGRVGFVAPFHTYEQALRYVRYWARPLRWNQPLLDSEVQS